MSSKINIQKKVLILLFILALIFRIFWAYIYNTYGPEYIFFDETTYKATADALWDYWNHASFWELFNYKKYAFGGFGGRNFGYNIIYALTSHYLGDFGARIVNSLFLCLAAYFTYLMGLEIADKRVALVAYTIVLFYPSGILYSITFHKEAFVIFSLSLLMLSLIKLFKKFSLKWFLIFLFGFLCVFTSRIYMAILALLSVSLVKVFNIRKKFSLNFILSILIGFILYYITSIIRENIGLTTLLAYYKQFSSSVKYNWSVYKKLGLPVNLTALVFYSFQPLPWNFTSIWFVPINLGSLIWYIMFPFFILGLIHSFKFKELRLIGVFILIVVMFYVLIYVTGTEYRHREQLISLLAILTSIGYYNFKLKPFYKKLLYFSLPCILVSMLALYKLLVLIS